MFIPKGMFCAKASTISAFVGSTSTRRSKSTTTGSLAAVLPIRESSSSPSLESAS